MATITTTPFRMVLAFGILCFTALTLILCNVLLYYTVKGKDRERLPGFTAASELVLSQLIFLVGVASHNWLATLLGIVSVLVLLMHLVAHKRKRT